MGGGRGLEVSRERVGTRQDEASAQRLRVKEKPGAVLSKRGERGLVFDQDNADIGKGAETHDRAICRCRCQQDIRFIPARREDGGDLIAPHGFGQRQKRRSDYRKCDKECRQSGGECPACGAHESLPFYNKTRIAPRVVNEALLVIAYYFALQVQASVLTAEESKLKRVSIYSAMQE